MPVNFSIGVPGYTCGDPFEVPPSRFSTDKGRRWTQALMKMAAMIAKQEGFDGYSDGKIQRLRGASNVSRLASKSGVREALNSDDAKQIAHQSVRENLRSSQLRLEASSRKRLGGFSKNKRIPKKHRSDLNKDTSSEDDVLDKKTSFDDVDSEEYELDSDDEEMALIRIREHRRNSFSDLTENLSDLLRDWIWKFTVSIFNFQRYRHVDEPGWRVSWVWSADEVIWSMVGAEAMEQGNCSAFQARVPLPHCLGS
ncbi:hypothetical protein Q3G72_031896 [Acer saccharum]|nr:hypothetical protein Q3G72_031896 [Acer saccharum]